MRCANFVLPLHHTRPYPPGFGLPDQYQQPFGCFSTRDQKSFAGGLGMAALVENPLLAERREPEL